MILCLGATPTAQRTMIFDGVTTDSVNRAVEVNDHASGKSINVARVATTLGEPAVATGFLGGERGEFIRRELERAGIAHRFVTVTPQTRLCTTVVDRKAGTATELVEESAPVLAGDWEKLAETFSELVEQATLCVFSGSLPPGGPPDFYARCAQAAAAVGKYVILDARGEPLLQAIRHPGLVIKLNREELGASVGRPVDTDSALRDEIWLATPPQGAVVVTLGAQGAVAYDGTDFWRIAAPQVPVISAVGSGDAFAAGLAVGLVRGEPFEDACAQGSACGAANAMMPMSGYVDPNVVQKLLEAATVSPW